LFRFKNVFFLPVILLLNACSTIEEQYDTETTVLETNELSAWHLSASEKRTVSDNRAIAQLLQQADTLMSEENYKQSADKLERLVRIAPRFAQAWSRLSWIALKNGDAKRSQQLAQRSNSYSRNNINLKILNWQFIKKAGELLDDVNIIQQAQKMILKLRND